MRLSISCTYIYARSLVLKFGKLYLTVVSCNVAILLSWSWTNPGDLLLYWEREVKFIQIRENLGRHFVE